MRRFLLAFVTLAALSLAPAWIGARPAGGAESVSAAAEASPQPAVPRDGAWLARAQAPGLPASLMLIAGLSGLLVAGDRRVRTRPVRS